MEIPRLITRESDSHKGTFGRALIVGGSRGMSGAVALAGVSALRAGAGLVTVAVPDRCLETVASYSLCYMTVPLPDDVNGRLADDADPVLRELSCRASSLGVGPGLSRSESVTRVVAELYVRYTGPMVVDADALNALASLSDVSTGGLPVAGGPRILTPHIGEFRRLYGDENLPADECREAAHGYAKANNMIVVLKGPATLVTNGETRFENTTGNPGMATGGSGDVLTGVTTSLLGQRYSPLDAAVLAVHVHGLAGDMARDRVGEISMNATDIIDSLPAAFQKLAQDSRSESQKMGF